jgi:hypothetical protein
MQKVLRELPPWLLLLMGFIAVVCLGYVDFLTGDYSLLIFYAIPVAVEAWFLGRWGAAATSLSAGAARFVSDYISYSGTGVRYWNSLQDMTFLLVVGLLIATVKKLLAEDQKKLQQ